MPVRYPCIILHTSLIGNRFLGLQVHEHGNKLITVYIVQLIVMLQDNCKIIMQDSKPLAKIPFSLIKQTFTIPILSMAPLETYSNLYFRAVTAFGNLCMIIEPVLDVNNRLPNPISRSQLMQENKLYFPLIFEQQTLKHHNQIYCITMFENCDSLTNNLKNSVGEIKMSSFTKLIQCLCLLDEKGYQYSRPITIKDLLFLKNSEEFFLDITHISKRDENVPASSYFKPLLECIIDILREKLNAQKGIMEVIFIQGKIYTFQIRKLNEASDYQQLLIFLNCRQDIQVTLINKYSKPHPRPAHHHTPFKPKPTKLKSLQGNPIIQINNKLYSSLFFEDGKCTNCLRQVFYQELTNKFIQEQSLYKLQQFEHLTVQVVKNGGNSNQEVIAVYPPVEKVELISFIIAYIRCIDPIVKSIEYLSEDNSLRLRFINKRNQEKVLIMVFYQQYAVKDQQISMILEKSNINQCSLDLRNIKISDCFLIFLANFDKAQHITQLYLTDTYGISDHGLSTYFRSKSSSNLQTLSIEADNLEQLQESIEQIAKKTSLRRLFLTKKILQFNSLEIDFSSLNLLELQSYGVRVNLERSFHNSLKILRLDQYVSIEELQCIRHLKLVELKIRLVESHRRSLIESFSSFSSLSNLAFPTTKNHFSKIFAEGEAKYWLRKLDLSFSNCKFKSLRPLLLMPELEQVNLENCINLGHQFESISSRILTLSLSGTQLSLDQVLSMLQKTKQLVQLNIIGTKIDKQDIGKLIISKQFGIRNLILSEKQYSNKLLESSNGYQLINCLELEIDRFLDIQQEYSFDLLMSKAMQSSKVFRFRTNYLPCGDGSSKNQVLMDRINKFMRMNSTNLEALQNIYSNKTRLIDLLSIQAIYQTQDSCECPVSSSVSISGDRCRIISSSKILIRKQNEVPVYLKALPNETIDKLAHRFVKVTQTNLNFISVDLNRNRVIGKEILDVLLRFGKYLVREISFLDCMFGFDDVVDQLFEFEQLDILNDGVCSIKLNHDNFCCRSQKYLKLFMRLRVFRKIQISCQQIEQQQILFSILCHITQHISPQIKTIILKFHKIQLTSENTNFLKILFSIKQLKHLQVHIHQCVVQEEWVQIWAKGINQLGNLESLYLDLPAFMFPNIGTSKIAELALEFNDGLAAQNNINKILKNVANSKTMRNLRVSAPNCPIENIQRVFGVLGGGTIFDRLGSLEHISLNFEYCSLKEQSLYESLNAMMRISSIKSIQLNLCFGIGNFKELVRWIEKLCDEMVRPVLLRIWCVTQNSNKYLLQTQNFRQRGIEFIV